jgi:putative serine protease PepD
MQTIYARRTRFQRLLLVLALIISVVGIVVNSPAGSVSAQQGAFDPNNALRSTVLIHQVYTNAQGDVIIACEGSGTLVSADGLILTNAHVALPSSICAGQRLVISLTLRIGEAPVPTYYAEVVNASRGFDLAVLRITNTLDGRPVDRVGLTLPFVEVGDSELLQLDDTIEVVGFKTPDGSADGGAAEVVIGTVTGFTAEARVGARAWIKTRAPIPGGMSGGGAYDIAGRLVGVPTVEPTRSDGERLDCRLVQDANNDGRVDQLDTCIPIGGLINAMRPARLARGLILAARLGVGVLTPDEGDPLATGATPRFTRLFFSPGVSAAGMPTSVVTGMPAGTQELYLFFDYEGLRDGMTYELRVTRDGVPDATFSLAPATWSGGERGLWYIGSAAQIWPNGVYEFTLFLDGKRSGDAAKITIGGPAQIVPSMSDILFGVQTPEGQLVSTGAVLPAAEVISAEFVFNNMTPELQWRRVWFYEDIRIPEEPVEQWNGTANGKRSVGLAAPEGQPFQPGRYRLEIWIGDRLAVTSDFLMAGAKVVFDTEIFSGLTFANSLEIGTANRVTGNTFPNTLTRLYGTFGWRDVAPGTPWTWRWTVDNNPLFEETVAWTGATGGEGRWVGLAARGTLPDGSYRLDLIVGGVVRATATARVGLGQLPITIFATAEGVQLQGEIVDAETGRGIPGVQIILLKVDFSIADFTQNLSEVYDLSLTDAQGQFTLSRRLLVSERPYSVLVLAQGYLPLTTDTLTVNEDTVSPIVLRLALNKD